jgi:hypothetical protein
MRDRMFDNIDGPNPTTKEISNFTDCGRAQEIDEVRYDFWFLSSFFSPMFLSLEFYELK